MCVCLCLSHCVYGQVVQLSHLLMKFEGLRHGSKFMLNEENVAKLVDATSIGTCLVYMTFWSIQQYELNNRPTTLGVSCSQSTRRWTQSRTDRPVGLKPVSASCQYDIRIRLSPFMSVVFGRWVQFVDTILYLRCYKEVAYTIRTKQLSKCWDKRPGRFTLKMPIHAQKASRY